MDDTGEKRFAAWNTDRRRGGFEERMLAIWLRAQTKCSYKVAYKSIAASSADITLQELVAAVRAQITRDFRARSNLKVVGFENPVARRWSRRQQQPRSRPKKPLDDVKRMVVNGGVSLEGWLAPRSRED